MMKKILSALTAAFCVFSLAACCTTEDAAGAEEAAPVAVETPEVAAEPVILPQFVDNEMFDSMMGDDPAPVSDPVQAEMICKADFQKYFTAAKKIVFETAPDGTRYARLYGRMNELPFLEWLVTDDGPRPYRYRFLLTGKDGSRTFSPVETRMITPGDAVRFSVKVPADCTGAILLLDKAD